MGAGGGHPDPEIRLGGSFSKAIFSALRSSVWYKNKGGAPLDPPLGLVRIIGTLVSFFDFFGNNELKRSASAL